jgi:uncharacterized protein DUF3467
MEEKKTINFTFVPDESSDVPRVYSNLCQIQHSPFDFTLTFCDMIPPSEKDIQTAQNTHVVKAPVRARLVLPIALIPTIVTLLQENFRMHQEAFGPPKGGMH